MPQALTYPGVYVEEVSSGVRTIAGVATSIALFIGWAKKGPIDKAGRVFSFADYEREYRETYAPNDAAAPNPRRGSKTPTRSARRRSQPRKTRRGVLRRSWSRSSKTFSTAVSPTSPPPG